MRVQEINVTSWNKSIKIREMIGASIMNVYVKQI